ncbi:MAG: hypothetical protein KAT07_04615 [Calditrichia bacterium]|nr:hypothetical protein [Calditrichia bacterium]
MSKIFFSIHVILFLLLGSGILFSVQEEISREAFYTFLEEFSGHLNKIRQTQDSSLSANTNLELQTRKWNDYLSQNLPKRIWVNIPVDKVTLGKASFQRLEAHIEFEFYIEIPEDNFQFENNIDAQNQFEVDVKLLERDQKNYLTIHPKVKNIIIEAGIASKHDIVEKKGHLLFEIKMNISRGSSWLQYYDTILSLNSVKWVTGDDILWELNILPFEEIMQRNK